MTSENRDAKSIFGEALRLSVPAERVAYLDQACAGDLALRQEVESLLSAHAQAGDFLDNTIPLPAPDFLIERTGKMIGRYKLLQKIGEGGFGVVYMAEQVEPLQRRVALKIIKAGMDSEEVIARFEAERQALALMDHPGIANILDAGATEAGRPYFVMELVNGIPITDYCDRKKLPTAERLQLFMKVCHAVQHAHQKGIIHRDLKPSNVLVTLHDGEPVPKVIDFGVVKALGQKLTQKTLFTGFQHLVGTPAYMSPEQAELSGLDVDTRSDIYSLGVLLYELLTGMTPFDKETLAKAAFDEMRRMIRETEPPKPSTRLNTLSQEALGTVAAKRQAEPAKLNRLVRGDLDWIVMKCLEKDRARRYETANNVALDVEHYLNHEPVSAAAPSALYEARKFIHRHKAGLAMAATVVLLLAVGVVVSTWQAVRASRAEAKEKAQRQRAEAEASKSQQVARFLKDMLNGLGPSVAWGTNMAVLGAIIDTTGERLQKELKGQPDIEAELRSTLGEVYMAFGQYGKAERMHREAVALRRTLWGNNRPEVADSLNNLSAALLELGKLDEAEARAREALALRKELFGNEHPSVAQALYTLACALRIQAKLPEAEALHWETLSIRRKLLGNDHPDVANSLSYLSTMLWAQGRLAQAEEMQREALSIRRKRFGDQHQEVATSLNNLALVLLDQGRVAEAETMQRQVIAIHTRVLSNEHPEVATDLNNLALALLREGRLVEAETLQREALAMSIKLLGHEHRQVAAFLNSLGAVLRDEGRLAEAAELHEQALAMNRNLFGEAHPAVASSLELLASVLERQGKLTEAESLLHKALVVRVAVLVPEHHTIARSLDHLVAVLLSEGKLAEAEPLARQCLVIREKRIPDDWRTFSTRSLLGGVLSGQKKYAEAEPLLLAGYEGMKQREARIPTNGRPRVKETLQRLVQLYEATDRPDQAAQWKLKLAEFEKTATTP